MNEVIQTEENTLSKKAERALARIDKLPSLSNVIGEFLEMSKREMISGRDLQRIISKDQALVSRLLKLANSSFYGKSKTINSITDAIVMIGLDNVKKIVYAVSSEGLTAREFKNYLYPEKGFWLHSMGVAVVSRLLNERVKSETLGDEQSFVAGLIHDVGKLIIDDCLDPGEGQREVSLETEIETVGMDHAELGRHIMDKWSIPEVISDAIKHHHLPRKTGEVHQNALIVSVADRICNVWNVGTQSFMDLGEDIEISLFEEDLAALNVPGDAFEETLWDARQKLASLEGLYESE